MSFDDPYFKSRLVYSLHEIEFQFDTAALLPSPYAIDPGTHLLLSHLVEKAGKARTILEIGCNYGVVGVVLAKLNPHAKVTMIDKDMLAVRYARHNAALNKVSNLAVIGSIGVESIEQQSFDLIIGHIPTKIGDRAIEYDLIVRPFELLGAGAQYWFVTESQLNRLIPGIARRHRLSLSEVDRREGYILFSIKKPQSEI
jgi:16S rRNA G1207 methylase RsmC